ncbi:MAG: flagellar protein FlhE [Halochromatium sp.]|uniref:flagellar protein FlhE n=1 Tax=Halochromatium sp. TaxID=2049430 RepID=UPI00397C92AC
MTPLLTLVLALAPGLAAAAGSWVANAPSLMVSMAERESLSRPLRAPPGSAPTGAIDSIAWRFEQPPGSRLNARLCQANRCMPLAGARGQSQALAGLPADEALRFHFSLGPGQRRAVRVQGLQVIVNYQ